MKKKDIEGLSALELLFLELLQVALGNRCTLSGVPTAEEWGRMRELCKKHTLTGVGFYAMQRLAGEERGCVPPRNLIMEMYSTTERLERRNGNLVADILNLTRILDAEGFDSCILKGQGLALLYPKGMVRMPGDIDVWVARRGDYAPLHKRRKDIVALCRKVVGRRTVHYHHTDLPLKGKDIEVHFTPSWMFAPWHNRRLQRFFDVEWQRRAFVDGAAFDAHDRALAAKGFYVPSVEMNAVFVLLHIYRHVFAEGVGLRQIVDYYFVLLQEMDRDRVLEVLDSLGMLPFAGAVMWVLQHGLGMKDDCLLCHPDEGRGQLLLQEIMMAGNFGKWDERLSGMDRSSLWSRARENMRRNLRLVRHYPSEALCAPIWKVWQKVWRGWNGY